MTIIVDYGTGNLRSVENALRRCGAEFMTTSDRLQIAAADRVILPGVGEASVAMAKLRERGLDECIQRLTCPVLGICIGVQLLCRSSEEGTTGCLGVFDCDVRLLRPEDKALKVPEMGWNTIDGLKSPLFEGIVEGSYVYYVHSYAPAVCDQTIAVTEYGAKFSAALQRGNFFGTQFHPEKSGETGRWIFENFLKL